MLRKCVFTSGHKTGDVSRIKSKFFGSFTLHDSDGASASSHRRDDVNCLFMERRPCQTGTGGALAASPMILPT